MEISALNNYLFEISHSGYLDYHNEDGVIPENLNKLTKYSTEIDLIRRCKLLIVSGRISKAHTIIRELQGQQSFQFMPFESVDKDDVLAFVNYECALFYRIVDDVIAYSNFLKIAKLLAVSPEIHLLIDYQFATIHAFNTLDINILQKFSDIFRRENLPVMEVMAYTRIAEIIVKMKQFSSARNYFLKTRELSRDIHSVNLDISAVSNIGFVYYLEGEFQKALDHFREIKNCKDYFQKSLVMENMALVFESQGDYSAALDHWMESLSICQDHGILMNIPEDTYHIGTIYEEQLDSVSKAKFFYKLGYDHSMRMFNDGINLSVDMRKVIEKYISYFAEYYVPDEKIVNKSFADPFSFAVDKSWEKIIEIFQHNVILFYKYNSDSVKELLEELQLKRSNFQAKQQKLIKKGYPIPDFRQKYFHPESPKWDLMLQSYIKNLRPATWKKLNKTFENDILKYLIHYYGTDKREFLRNKLKISSPNLKKKLDNLA